MTPDGQTGEAMVADLEQLMSDSLHKRGVATSQPPPRATVEDPVFPHLIAWLASEFGLEDIPLLAAKYPCPDHLNPHREQLGHAAAPSGGAIYWEWKAPSGITVAGYTDSAASGDIRTIFTKGAKSNDWAKCAKV